jgi:hypothetical protein
VAQRPVAHSGILQGSSSQNKGGDATGAGLRIDFEDIAPEALRCQYTNGIRAIVRDLIVNSRRHLQLLPSYLVLVVVILS